MNSRSERRIPCACACQENETLGNSNSTATPGQNQNVNLNDFTRPSMATLHQMLQNMQWKEIQDAIRKDASVAMRIDDSPKEDAWFDEARRGKAARMGIATVIASSVDNSGDAVVLSGKQGEAVGSHETSRSNNSAQEDYPPPMELRYWVGNQTDDNNRTHSPYAGADIEAYLRATVDIQQKRTLLHSLCRMYFPSNEALIVQLKHNDTEGLTNLMGAVETAQMLIEASHNDTTTSDDDEKKIDDSPNGTKSGEEGTANDFSSHRHECPCQFYRHYCPPVFLPRVERPNDPAGSRDGHSINSEEDVEMIKHTSVLTMVDAMGESPLHSLAGAGSSHIDLMKVFLKACRPLDELIRGVDGDRRPTVYDLLIAQNFHGCTPLHFLADSKNEEVIRLLLEKCQFHNLSPGRIHPTMIRDNEGDLALHFAACNGAAPSLLHTLTTLCGDVRSSLVRNSQGRLAIDDIIEWYIDNLNEQMDHGLSEGDDSSEVDSEDDSDGSETSLASSNSPTQKKSMATLVNTGDVGGPKQYVMRISGFLSGATNWEIELWDPMWVLIQAAATAVRNSADGGQRNTCDNAWLPIHAAVIATKYANFPALTVVASILRNSDVDAKHIGEDHNIVSERENPLLERDTYGYLPLHWACGGDISSLLSAPAPSNGAAADVAGVRRGVATCAHNQDGSTDLNEANDGPLNPSASKCESLVRWNTKDLPCSIIEHLLCCEPIAARIPTRQGRLPLHLLAEDGNSFNHLLQNNEKGSVENELLRQPWDDIIAILKEYPDALRTPDPANHLYPFQVAAASLKPSHHTSSQPRTTGPHMGLLPLENTYRLIMEDPSLLCQIIEK